MKTDELTITIEYALSQPPAAAGLRLKSQRELASLFQTHESQVRKSLEKLVRRGLLVRRRGSGTFVRRVADVPDQRRLDKVQPLPGTLFTEVPDQRSAAGYLGLSQRRLEIGLWGDLQFSAAQTNHRILAGVASSINDRGHRLTIHSVLEEPKKPFPVGKIRDQLQDNPCDGYLVTAAWGNEFTTAAEKLHLPVMFFCSGTLAIIHEPLVMNNTIEACERGLRTLAAQGYQRIALVSMMPPTYRAEYKTYEDTMRDLGMDYRLRIKCKESLGESFATMRRALSSSSSPDALYIADDTILAGVAEALVATGRQPGKDIGVITISNTGMNLPGEVEWSHLEFDPEHFGHMLVDNLLWMLERAGATPRNISIHASWRPGRTHQRNGLERGS